MGRQAFSGVWQQLVLHSTDVEKGFLSNVLELQRMLLVMKRRARLSPFCLQVATNYALHWNYFLRVEPMTLVVFQQNVLF